MLHVRDRKGRHSVLLLAVEPQGCATGCQHLQARRTRKQRRNDGCCLQNLLEVVEQEEHTPLAEVVFEALIERYLSCLFHPKRLSDGREEQFGFCQGCERHEEGTVGELIKEVGCCLQGYSCLANP